MLSYDRCVGFLRNARFIGRRKFFLWRMHYGPCLRLLLHPFLFRGDIDSAKTLLILGHQRSGSSLLAHVLNSNPAICGYVEAHFSYRRPQDVRWLWAFLRRNVSPAFDPKVQIALDKMVDGPTCVYPPMLRNGTYRYIFLVREPVGTIASFVNSFHSSMQSIERNYISRLSQLQQFASFLSKENSYFIRYEELIDHTAEALDGLTRFLSLPVPLRSAYSIEKMTGKLWFGDPTAAILTGEIRDIPEAPCDIPPDVLERCRRMYEETCAKLAVHCEFTQKM